MSKKIFLPLLMASSLFPSPNSYGENIPEQQANVRTKSSSANQIQGQELINLMLLSEYSLYKSEKDILKLSNTLLKKAETITSPSIKRIVVFTISKIINDPKNHAKILEDHNIKIGEYFAQTALQARNDKHYDDALYAVQIAVRCDPSNANARLLFANLLSNYLRQPDKAIQTLYFGLQYLHFDDANIAPIYLNRFFDTLSELQQDRTIIVQTTTLINDTKIKKAPETTQALAKILATAQFHRGEYKNCIKTLEKYDLDGTQPGIIFKSRAMFENKETNAALSLLSDSIKKFPSDKRDDIFAQIINIQTSLGNIEQALETTETRIAETPDIPAPYAKKLFLLHQTKKTEEFQNLLNFIFEKFPTNNSALMLLANFSAQQGIPEIAKKCFEKSIVNKFNPATFGALYIESYISTNLSSKAVETYNFLTQSTPDIFKTNEKTISAILGIAVADLAQKTNTEEKEKYKNQSTLLLAPYLKGEINSPDQYIATISLLKRINNFKLAKDFAQAGSKKFPWHSQIKANLIALRIQLDDVNGTATAPDLITEINVLLSMRRPDPTIWKEIALWLETQPSTERITAIRSKIEPLIRIDIIHSYNEE